MPPSNIFILSPIWSQWQFANAIYCQRENLTITPCNRLISVVAFRPYETELHFHYIIYCSWKVKHSRKIILTSSEFTLKSIFLTSAAVQLLENMPIKELTSKKTWPKSQVFNYYKLLCVNVCWQEEVSRDRACVPLSIRGGAATSCVAGRPTRELQSLLHMMKLEESIVELFLPRSRFCSALWWRLMSAFSNPSFTVRLHRARSRAASSQLFGSISHALRSRFHASFNCIAGRSTFLTPVGNWP